MQRYRIFSGTYRKERASSVVQEKLISLSKLRSVFDWEPSRNQKGPQDFILVKWTALSQAT